MNGWVLFGTAFAASAVEFVEAATIVLAVGFTQGWRSAALGTLGACAALGAIVLLLGPLLVSASSLREIQLVVGPFLIVFGIAWLRKAIWRFAGRKPMRDENAAYAREVERLRADRERHHGTAVAFSGVFIEGLEVAVIVVTFGARSAQALTWSFAGALAALALVTLFAVAVHRPFARVPENALKAVVGVMLLSLGTFWTGEALGIEWWFGDPTLFVLVAVDALAAALAVAALRTRGARAA